MKTKRFMYALMGAMLVISSCSDNELENNGVGAGQPVNNSPLVNVYSDNSGSEESLLAGDVLVRDSRTLTLNVPVTCEKVYMKYNTVSGKEATKEFALSPVTRSTSDQGLGFNFEMNRNASVTLILPEDAVQPTSETDDGYLFYHNTGVVMFEDGWPTQAESWYDDDFNDVVCEYDLKVTECQSAKQMEIQGSKEELLLTLDIRAVGGTLPGVLGVVLEKLDSKYVDQISASLYLKGGQGTMRELGQELLSTKSSVKVDVRNWKWDKDTEAKRYSILTVDKSQPEGTVIELDGLGSLKDNNNDLFQVTPGKVIEGLPMLRAEVRLIGKANLTGAERAAQLEAFRELILDTNRQNFFIKANGKEIHMKGYAPTSSYKEKYDAIVANDAKLDANVYYSNTKGSTWGVKVPVGTRHTAEEGSKIKFSDAYAGFANWVNTKGAEDKDWYLYPNPDKTIRYW